MKKFFREYRIEILALLLALVGIFLLVEQFEIRKSVYAFVAQVLDFIPRFAGTVETSIIAYITSFTLSDLIGWILIIFTGVFIIWRVRYRFTPGVVAIRCLAPAQAAAGKQAGQVQKGRQDGLLQP